MRLFRIVAPWFVAGIEVDLYTSCYIRSAPIIKYMKGWNIGKIKSYCKKRGFEIREIK